MTASFIEIWPVDCNGAPMGGPRRVYGHITWNAAMDTVKAGDKVTEHVITPACPWSCLTHVSAPAGTEETP